MFVSYREQRNSDTLSLYTMRCSNLDPCDPLDLYTVMLEKINSDAVEN